MAGSGSVSVIEPLNGAAAPTGATAPMNLSGMSPMANLASANMSGDSIAPLEAQQEGAASAAGAAGMPNLNSLTSGMPGMQGMGAISPMQLQEEIALLEALIQREEQQQQQAGQSQSGSGSGASPGGAAPAASGGSAPMASGGGGGGTPAGGGGAGAPSTGASPGSNSGSAPAASGGNPNNTSSSPLSSGNNAQQIMSFFEGKGLSPTAAAGIVGNLQQESSLDPNAPGGGLAQWGGSRLSALDAQAGTSSPNMNQQLNYMWTELSGGPGAGENDSSVLKQLQGAKTPAQAADIFSAGYERPGDPQNQNREAYANQAYKQYGGAGKSATA